MVPTRVRMSVATMMPTAVPALTLQEENAMLSAVSFSGTPGTRGFTGGLGDVLGLTGEKHLVDADRRSP